MEQVLTIKGMGCAACMHHVEEALKEVSGVTAVVVSLEEKLATVQGIVPSELLIRAVENAGYEAQVKE